jgi:3-deoxy-D-manno-octulosonic acid kinase
MEAPPPFMVVRGPEGIAWTRPEARAWVSEVLASGRTLHAAAREDGYGDDLAGGRGPTPLVRSREAVWVVRHGFRGGLVARLLEDRHLRLGPPRPFREAAASEAVRRSGIPTPRVVAAAVYPAGPFYRGDVMTELVPAARNLAEILFGETRSRDPALRKRLLREAGDVPGRLARAAVRHPDLNVTNLLVPREDEEPRIVLLDLDRCRVHEAPLPDDGRRMVRRLARSLRRGEERRGPVLDRDEWDAFSQGATRAG